MMRRPTTRDSAKMSAMTTGSQRKKTPDTTSANGTRSRRLRLLLRETGVSTVRTSGTRALTSNLATLKAPQTEAPNKLIAVRALYLLLALYRLLRQAPVRQLRTPLGTDVEVPCAPNRSTLPPTSEDIRSSQKRSFRPLRAKSPNL